MRSNRSCRDASPTPRSSFVSVKGEAPAAKPSRKIPIAGYAHLHLLWLMVSILYLPLYLPKPWVGSLGAQTSFCCCVATNLSSQDARAPSYFVSSSPP